jgi:competence protein ComEC
VSVSAKLAKPTNFETDAGREFDYVNYLGKDDIYYTLPFAEFQIKEVAHKGKFRRSLFTVKKSFLSKVEEFVPEPESALLGGVLLGEKQSLGDELEDAFVATGLIHIVVLSGYNVSIVAEAVTYVLAFLPRALAYGASSFGILLFMILTGANAPIVRASIMAILLLVAKFLGRPTEASRMLLLVATIMVLIKPSILASDVSFHLSFLATLGLLYMFPIVDNFFAKKIPSLLGLREIASATISTQIFVLPYLLWKIGTFSIISPITNIIVLPFIPLSMLLGFFTGVFGYVWSPIASLLSYLSFFVVKIVIEIVEWFAGFSFSFVAVPEIPFVVVLAIYGLLGYYLYKRQTDNGKE